jgi:ribonucleoside-diphosphate reductase alpha chain
MAPYTYLQVLEASTEYFSGDDFAAKVFVDKYALQNQQGEFLELTPTDMHRRLAKEFARIEAKYPNPMTEDEIFGLLDRYRYICPQGSPMFGIGNPYYVQSLGNCFVVESPFDSYGGLLKTDQEMAQLMKRRAGVGTDMANIRPKGLSTNNAAKTTDGIAIFMDRFSNTCREVAQFGRRGALMLSNSIRHPEIETFINIKRDSKRVTGANISVRIYNDFMKAVKANGDFTLQWPVNSKTPIVSKTVKAKVIWDQIIKCAWESAEPGILFWDHIIDNSPADIYAEKYPNFKTQSTNPCGELPLGLDSCRLLVVNLLSFVTNPFTKKAKFDYDLYAMVCQKAQRLMDDLVDLEIEKIEKLIEKVKSDPEPETVKAIELNMWKQFLQSCTMGRRTGTGITALGDCLAALGIRYGSKQSIEITNELYRQLMINTYKSSFIMAGERGAFPIFDAGMEKGHPFIVHVLSQDKELATLYKKNGRRNIALLTTAPTGSVSTQTQTTSGIEPAYLLEYKRRKKINASDKSAKIDFVDQLGDKWQEFTVYHHGFKQWMEISGESDPTKSPYYKATSNDIDWVASVDLQAAAQQHIDHSISKTCNLPNSATEETVAQVYMRAWEMGCKGFTVYRDGCRSGVLISTEEKKEDTITNRPPDISISAAPKRPVELPCEIKKVKVQGEQWTIFVGMFKQKPYEVFGGLSKYLDIPNKYKTGKLVKNGKVDGITAYNLVIGENDEEMTVKDIANVFENKNYGSFTRLLSLSLRHGTPLQYIVEQLSKDKHSDLTSFSKVVSRVLKSYIKDGASASEKICPSCQGENTLIYQEGCLRCTACVFSKCN